jgi:phage/plasmid-associated DNA primase
VSTDDDLELVRSIRRRAIAPAKQLQTGFWIYGTAGTGKSTMVHWIASIMDDLCEEMSVKNCTLFTNARLKGKSLVTVSDVDQLRFLKPRDFAKQS